MCFGRVCVVYVVVCACGPGLLTGLSQLLSLFSIVRGKKTEKGREAGEGREKEVQTLKSYTGLERLENKNKGQRRQKEKTENAGQCEGCWTMKELTRAKTESWHL